MTQVVYDCKLSTGEFKRVNTLAEAKCIRESGGSFQINYLTEISQNEAFCRKGARCGCTPIGR